MDEVSKYPGIRKILVARDATLLNPYKIIWFIHFRYGDHVSHTLNKVVKGSSYDKVVGNSSAFGKDVIPRLGGLLDVQPITDVIQIIVFANFHSILGKWK